MFGDDYAPMTIKTDDGSPLFQVPNPFGNDWGGVNKELYSVKPSSEFDSWLIWGRWGCCCALASVARTPVAAIVIMSTHTG